MVHQAVNILHKYPGVYIYIQHDKARCTIYVQVIQYSIHKTSCIVLYIGLNLYRLVVCILGTASCVLSSVSAAARPRFIWAEDQSWLAIAFCIVVAAHWHLPAPPCKIRHVYICSACLQGGCVSTQQYLNQPSAYEKLTDVQTCINCLDSV